MTTAGGETGRRNQSDLSSSLRGKDKKRYDALLALRDELTQQVRELSSASLVSSKQAGEELADVGSDDFVRETELSLMGTEAGRLQLIDEAVERLGEGTYGRCVECDCEISDARLDAIPYAQLCIECKSDREAEEAGRMRTARRRRG